MKKIVLVALAVLLVGFGPWRAPVAVAASVTQYVCRDVYLQDLGARGSTFRPVSCGWDFSAADQYLVLYAQIDRVDRDMVMTSELVDPTGATVHTERLLLRERVGSILRYTVVWVLPLSVGSGQLPDRLRRYDAIEPEGAPARERLGEWQWKITLASGTTATARFMLKP